MSINERNRYGSDAHEVLTTVDPCRHGGSPGDYWQLQGGLWRRSANPEDQPSVSWRHDRYRRFPRPALPQVRRGGREANERRAEIRDLSRLVADEDRGA